MQSKDVTETTGSPIPTAPAKDHSGARAEQTQQLKLQWQTQGRAPDIMLRGAAVTHHNTIYCIPRWSNTIFLYEVESDEWQKHSVCPLTDTGLAMIQGLLTAVGGKERFEKTKKLVSWRDGRWEEVFPPMNIARSDHAVVSDDSYVIAVGGEGGETSVELYCVSTKTWCRVASLPEPLDYITATLSVENVYAMDMRGQTYLISMSHLTRDTSRELSHPHPTWQPLPCAPVDWSTLSMVNGEVVAVGGERGSTSTGDIHQLYKGEWVKIGCMNIKRYWPIVAVLPGNRIVVIGGPSTPSSASRAAVELAVPC